ncbi:MAG: hypothetical protein SO043_11285, partial [Lachnospiraceae bacterium]|nr:hypothetical protein [Lachnospiraceae bacterium]
LILEIFNMEEQKRKRGRPRKHPILPEPIQKIVDDLKSEEEQEFKESALRVLKIKKSATILSSSDLPGSRDTIIPSRYPSIGLKKCCARNQPKKNKKILRNLNGQT